MTNNAPPKIPKKYQPKGFEVLYEDLDLIIGNKAAGALTVAALWNKEDTVHSALNRYVRKGNPKSRKSVFVVHRLDQATTGVLVFAKSEEAQEFLKENWQENEKIYVTIVRGRLKEKSGAIKNYLIEDEDYNVRATKDRNQGRYAETHYEVLAENEHHSLLRVKLVTGRKNQIRVHLADLGHPILGDTKYGGPGSKQKLMALHSYSLTLTHPFNKKRLTIKAPIPAYFKGLVAFDYEAI